VKANADKNRNNSRDPVKPEFLPAVATARPVPALIEADVLETGFEAPRRMGLMIAFMTFGVFGLWSAVAPIEGAVHAMGVVSVKSYKKVVQHLEGGIVKEIRVQNGDTVKAGDVLLVLDSTQSAAQLEISNAQLVALSALEARLITERDNLDAIAFPQNLLASGAQAATEMAGQNRVFTTRKAAREGAVDVLNQRIGQLEARVTGLAAVRDSKLALAASFEDEVNDLQSLLAEGFADKLRLREVERSHALTSGEAADLAATIASTEIQVGETRLQIIQLQNEFQSEVATQLTETQSQLKDIRERVLAFGDIVARTEIRAPADGLVNNLQVHTAGAVVPGGAAIGEIVPQNEELIIEAQILPVDIDRVIAGQAATVRLSAFNTRTVPTMDAVVLGVSADSVLDQASGASYYNARIEINPDDLAQLVGLDLLPGMPAEVLISTGSRTFLQYLMHPLTNSMARAFIEE
jgi:epimerase transport system membrane fusion protein